MPAEARDFLLETLPRMFHERDVAAIPEFAMALDRSPNAIACSFDLVFVDHFPVKRRKLPVPVNDFGCDIF